MFYTNFNYQHVHNNLLVIEHLASKKDKPILINYYVNKLNSLFTSYYEHIPSSIIKLYDDQYSVKYDIQYIPNKYDLKAVKLARGYNGTYANNLNKAQIRGVKYFKRDINSNYFEILNGLDIKNISKVLDNGLCKFVINKKGKHLKSHICSLHKLFLGIPIYLRRYLSHLISLFAYIIVVFLVIVSLFLVFGITATSSSDTKLDSLTYSKEYSMIKNNVNYRNEYKKVLKENHIKYRKGYKNFNEVHRKLTNDSRNGVNQNIRINNELSPYIRNKIMIITINYGFLHTLEVYSILALGILIYLKIKLKKIDIKFFSIEMGKIVSVQAISAIGIYSIVINFIKGASSEPILLANAIFIIISIMCVAFTVNILCSGLVLLKK